MKFENFAFLEFLKKVKQKFWALGLIPQQVLQLYLALPRLRVEGKIRSENFRWGAEVPYVFQKYSLLADPIDIFRQSWNVGGDSTLAKKKINKNCPSEQGFRRTSMSSGI
jgi:hypothetical protein